MTATRNSASSGAGAPAARRPSFRLDVQGLRAVAVLLVVLFHTGLVLPGGFVGVDVFFVVSGFVIGGVLVRELEHTGSVGLARFYARRARRLLPALALLLVVGLLLTPLVLSPLGGQQLAARTALAASAFAANIYLYAGLDSYFAPAAENNPFLHIWSLSLEEQLYFVLPATMLLAERVRRRLVPAWSVRTGAAVVVGVLSLASFALSASMASGTNVLGVANPRAFAFYGAPTRVWEFGAGVLLAMAAAHLPRLSRRAAPLLGVVGLALVLVAAVTFSDRTSFPGIAALLPVAGTVLLIVAGSSPSFVSAALSTRPLTWVGDRSYAWYLWHWPLIVFSRLTWPSISDVVVVVAAFGSLVPAALSYRFLEQPLRLRRDIVGGRALQVALVCLIVPAVLAAFVLGRAEHAETGGQVRGAGGETVTLPPPAELEARTLVTARCMGREGDPVEWPGEECTFGPADPTGTVLLLGDSHAASLSDVVTEAATSLGLGTAAWSRASCAFVRPGPFGPDPQCEQWQAAAMALVDQLAPDVVVIGAKTEGIGVEFWRPNLGYVLDELEARGIPVVLVEPVPVFETSPAELGGGVDELPTLTLEQVEEQRGPVVALQRELVAAHSRMVSVDPVPWICEDTCSQLGDGSWTYFDQNHLTPPATLRLLEPLTGALQQVLVPA